MYTRCQPESELGADPLERADPLDRAELKCPELQRAELVGPQLHGSKLAVAELERAIGESFGRPESLLN